MNCCCRHNSRRSWITITKMNKTNAIAFGLYSFLSPSLLHFISISKGGSSICNWKSVLANGMSCSLVYIVQCTHCTHPVEEYSFIFIYTFIHFYIFFSLSFLFFFDPQLIKNLAAKNANIYRFICTNPKCECSLICCFPSYWMHFFAPSVDFCHARYLDSC